MSESSDYEPSSWSRNHDFSSARDVYVEHTKRSYSEAQSSNVRASDLIPASVSTKCKRPLIFVFDETNSMETWPATMFSKFPYLEYEGKEYLGQDLEFCFMANGDARNHEDYPLQVRPFVKEKAIKEKLEELVQEKKGGGNDKESYELPAFYCLHNVKLEPDAKPILIFICDEGLYDEVTVGDAKKYARVDLKENMSVKELFAKLKKKNYSIYAIRKKYDASEEAKIQAQWAGLIGEDHVAMLDDPKRVVDVVFGILAKEMKRSGYFEEEFEERQKDHPEYFPVVYKALRTIHRKDGKKSTKSQLHVAEEEGQEAKPLI